MLRGTVRTLGLRYKSSSISALAYKVLHRNMQRPPLPTIASPKWSTDAAISSILYETPSPRKIPKKPKILQCLVQNEPGVLSRVSGTLAARGFNIESLVVCSTEVKNLSRMTIVLHGQPGVIEQARRQVEDLVPVWAVLDYSDAPLVERELLLAKISLLGPEYFEQLVRHHAKAQKVRLGESPDSAMKGDEKPAVHDFHPSNIPISQALRHKSEHLQAIKQIAEHYGGKVADISDRNCIVELCASPEEITRFVHLVQPFGVIEVVRSGMSALTRTPLDIEEEAESSAEVPDPEVQDLPPG